MSRFGVRLSDTARQDIADILRWSEDKFGAEAADRYALLLSRALDDIAKDPRLPGAKQREDLQEDVFTYHLFFSRLSQENEVKSPRHFVVYRSDKQYVDVLRVLHESRDLVRHV